MRKSPVRKDIEACGGRITDTIMDNVFEVDYKNHHWWIGRPAEEKKYVVQFAYDAIAGEFADFCEPNKQALQEFMDQKIEERSKKEVDSMNIEIIEYTEVECNMEELKQLVGQASAGHIALKNIKQKTRIVRDKETGEEYTRAVVNEE